MKVIVENKNNFRKDNMPTQIDVHFVFVEFCLEVEV